MSKLIKISDTHYIVACNSKIKKNDKFIIESTINTPYFAILTANSDDEGIKGRLKVIYSTEPIEFREGKKGEVVLYFNKIKELKIV